MATYVNDLRLKEIATGDESGTWGTSTNTNLSLIADAFSLGTKQMAADADETFTMPDATADGTRSLYLKITSAVSLTTTRTVTLAPNTVSKVWIIENATTGSQIITIAQGSGATVNVPNGSKVMVVTDGAGSGAAVFNANPTTTSGTVTSVGGTGTVNGITLTGTVTSSGNLTLGGTLANVNLTSQVTGTLPIANGGTGITSFGAGVATFLGTPSSANLAAAVTDETGSGALVFATSPTLVTPILGTPQSGTLTNATGLPIDAGTTGTLPVARGGTGTTSTTFANLTTNVTGTLPIANGGTGTTSTTFANLTTNVTGTLPVANGGTGATSLTANNVILGNGTSAVQVVAPGTTGNVLTSNGTTWTSAAAGAALSGVTDSGSPFETSLGFGAGAVNTGARNTFIGFEAGNDNTTGTDNVAVGYQALDANTTGTNNVAVGVVTLQSNTTGSYNSAFGWYSMNANTTGGSNTASGVFSMSSNTTGSSNTAYGYQSLYSNTVNGFNTAVGRSALQNSTAANNTALGHNAGLSVSTGQQNTLIGQAAGYSGTNDLTTGSNNIILGYNAAASSATVSNEVTIGNASITKLRVPGLSVDWAVNDVPFRNIPQNSQSAAYTLVASDAGKHIFHPSADTTARTFTIPANGSVAYPIGTAITFINQNGAGVITIAITTDTMRLSPAGTTGSRTLAANGSATCIKITSTEWLISGSGLT